MSTIRAEVKDTLSLALSRAASSVLVEARRLVNREGLRLAGKVQEHLKARGIYDTGELRKSVIQREYAGYDFVFSEVGTNSRYAEAVHEGRKPGTWVPVDPLIKWVRRRVKQGRFTLATPKGKRRKRGAKLSVKDQEMRGIAYAIRAGIYKRGIQGRPFMDEVHAREEAGIRARIGQGLFVATRKAVLGE